MDMSIARPLHGWRPFAGEVGVIVLGVLLALGAQQIAQNMQSESDERSLRESIDHEIGLNLFIYDVRARQFACDSRRVDELQAWLDRARAGEVVPGLRPALPLILTPYRSAWENRDAQVFNRLPAQRRQKYAEFYDELSNNWAIMERESDQWALLIPYAEAGPITLADRRTIRPIITLVGDANATLQGNLPIANKIAEELMVKQVQPDNLPPEWINDLNGCRSVIAASDQVSAPGSPG